MDSSLDGDLGINTQFSMSPRGITTTKFDRITTKWEYWSYHQYLLNEKESHLQLNLTIH